MAVELAAIICQDCQAEFHKRGKKINRVEALSWKEWAEAKIVLCPHCRTKRLREEKADAIHKIFYLPEISAASEKQQQYADHLRTQFLYANVEFAFFVVDHLLESSPEDLEPQARKCVIALTERNANKLIESLKFSV